MKNVLDSCEPVDPKCVSPVYLYDFLTDLGSGFVGGWKMFSMSKSYLSPASPASICLHGVFAAAGAAISVARDES